MCTWAPGPCRGPGTAPAPPPAADVPHGCGRGQCRRIRSGCFAGVAQPSQEGRRAQDPASLVVGPRHHRSSGRAARIPPPYYPLNLSLPLHFLSPPYPFPSLSLSLSGDPVSVPSLLHHSPFTLILLSLSLNTPSLRPSVPLPLHPSVVSSSISPTLFNSLHSRPLPSIPPSVSPPSIPHPLTQALAHAHA